jgi:hypothetical protein
MVRCVLAAMLSCAVPVVEGLLAASLGVDGVTGLLLGDQRLGLAALDAALKKMLAEFFGVLFGVGNARTQGVGVTLGGVRLREAGDAIDHSINDFG